MRLPSLGLLLVTTFSVVAFFGLAAWGWGDIKGLLGHPARVGGLAVIAGAAVASLFSGIHLGGCSRPDSHGQWRLAPLAVISLALAWLPAHADRHDLATIDGDLARYLGLGLLLIGAVMRVGPMFLLGDRFTWPLASQSGHALLTTGCYRWVRHPSYGGALIGAIGWALLFRSGLGLILVGCLFPFFLPVIRAEESLLIDEFGKAYKEYVARDVALDPLVLLMDQPPSTTARSTPMTLGKLSI